MGIGMGTAKGGQPRRGRGAHASCSLHSLSCPRFLAPEALRTVPPTRARLRMHRRHLPHVPVPYRKSRLVAARAGANPNPGLIGRRWALHTALQQGSASSRRGTGAGNGLCFTLLASSNGRATSWRWSRCWRLISLRAFFAGGSAATCGAGGAGATMAEAGAVTAGDSSSSLSLYSTSMLCISCSSAHTWRCCWAEACDLALLSPADSG